MDPSKGDSANPTSIGTKPPFINPAPAGTSRPLWSVMIPAYNPSTYLEETLRCVLDQDPGPDVMQIAVVDDASPSGRTKAIVDGLASGRIEFIQQPTNVGIARNWNSCIEWSRGQLVHILHQDDLVLPGFYECLGRAAAAYPSAGAFFCRHAVSEPDGHWLSISPLESRKAGLLDGWLQRLCQGQRLRCPSIAVRRRVYEDIGGFNESLKFFLDWEMWVRIASRYPFYYEPTFFACHRRHPSTETLRLQKQRLTHEECKTVIDMARNHVASELREVVGLELRESEVARILTDAARCLSEGDILTGLFYFRDACTLKPSLYVSRRGLSHYARSLFCLVIRFFGLKTRARTPLIRGQATIP